MPDGGYPARRCDVPYTAAEDAQMVEARALGFSWRAIALLLGRGCSGAAVQARWLKLADRAKPRQTSQRGMRECMTCKAPFVSEHFGNRMCDECRERSTNIFDP